MLHLCNFGEKAGVVVNSNQECPGVYHPVAAFLGWLWLLWARGQGLAEAAGLLGSLDYALACALKAKGKHKLSVSPSHPEFHSLTFGNVPWLSPIYVSRSLKTKLFSVPQGKEPTTSIISQFKIKLWKRGSNGGGEVQERKDYTGQSTK